MSTHRRLSRPSIFVLAVALAGLAACQKPANQASSNPTDAPAPLAAMALTNNSTLPPPAPATTALPPAPPIRTGRLAGPASGGYAYVDRAYEVNHGFGDAPPDYGFDYDGGQPWAWRSDDGYERINEPVNGGDRDYYYEPNSDEPFLVRDDDYSYGYRGEILVIVYDRQGRPLPADGYGQYSDRAARLFYRARALRDAEHRQPHRGVGRTPWQQRRDAMMSDRQAWAQQQQSNADWRAYHDQTAQQDAAFDAMRARREAEAIRVDQALQDRQAEARDQQAAQRAQAVVQAQAQAQGRPTSGFHPPAPPPVSGPPVAGPLRQATGPLTPPPSQGPPIQGRSPGPGRFSGQPPVNGPAQAQAQAQARLQAQQAVAASRAAAASQAQANAQAVAQRQAEAQAAGAKARSDALARQQAAQQARVQAQQQTAAQAQARAQALAQQQQQGAAQRQAQQAAAAQQRAQALAQQQAQMKARQATQQQTATDAQARAQAAAQQRQQAQAAAQQQRQAAIQARKNAAVAQAAANAKAHPKPAADTANPPAPK